jgi:glutamine amidotransferase|tara:strand:+ start:853 stop:1434 length:582 start_codon:yes stop_codon:yes gene_type:complete
MMIAIIDFDAGNTKSLQFALDRLGVENILTSDIEKINSADKVIFPGQGAAKSAMKKIIRCRLDKVIPKLKQPVLGICLGMQLFCEISEEDNVKGLGIIKSKVKLFSNKTKVPQIGWNKIFELNSPLFNGISENEYMYLVHSYYVPKINETIAKSYYGINYSVSIKKDNFYGVQFHPEKSSKSGQLILKNFLKL